MALHPSALVWETEEHNEHFRCLVLDYLDSSIVFEWADFRVCFFLFLPFVALRTNSCSPSQKQTRQGLSWKRGGFIEFDEGFPGYENTKRNMIFAMGCLEGIGNLISAMLNRGRGRSTGRAVA